MISGWFLRDFPIIVYAEQNIPERKREKMLIRYFTHKYLLKYNIEIFPYFIKPTVL